MRECQEMLSHPKTVKGGEKFSIVSGEGEVSVWGEISANFGKELTLDVCYVGKCGKKL